MIFPLRVIPFTVLPSVPKSIVMVLGNPPALMVTSPLVLRESSPAVVSTARVLVVLLGI
ncbi:hypothetical protein D3C80_2148780 [compost metagenome]